MAAEVDPKDASSRTGRTRATRVTDLIFQSNNDEFASFQRREKSFLFC